MIAIVRRSEGEGWRAAAEYTEPASVMGFDRQRCVSDALPSTRYRSWSRSLVIGRYAATSSPAGSSLSKQSSQTESDRSSSATTPGCVPAPKACAASNTKQFRLTLMDTPFSELPARRITQSYAVDLDVLRGFWPDVSQFYHDLSQGRPQVYDSKDGEMSEWSIEHAWKSDLFTRADAHQIPPTQFRSTT